MEETKQITYISTTTPAAHDQQKGTVVFVGGIQRGDEGKGAFIDRVAKEFDVVARCAGGRNAGHTIVVDGKPHKFNQIPSAMINQDTSISKAPVCLLGNGVVVDVEGLFGEIDNLVANGIRRIHERIRISNRAALVLNIYKEIDVLQEDERTRYSAPIGTTRKGVGPAYEFKYQRSGLRLCNLMGDWTAFCREFETVHAVAITRYPRLADSKAYNKRGNELELLRGARLIFQQHGMVIDTVQYIHRRMNDENGFRLLVEGANAANLDVDFGTYPCVTSSNCTIGGALTGLGLTPFMITGSVGVVKAYLTSVGTSPMPTRLEDEVGAFMRQHGHEIGTVTGRTRDCGWFDAVVANWGIMVNGTRKLMLTKLDVLSGISALKVCTGYVLYGEKINSIPADIQEYKRVEPVYETMSGWFEPIDKVRSFGELPEAARRYVAFLQKSMACASIEWISVGPGRDEFMIVTDKDREWMRGAW